MAPTDKFTAAVEAGLRRASIDFSRPLLIAFSGGPDSSALLLACTRIRAASGLRIVAAHFDHQLRGAESGADAAHVAGVCKRLEVPHLSGTGDVAGRVRREGLSVEAAARELRYRFLAQAAKEANAQAVATGHTMDDQAETVLLAIARGSGLRGISGMRAVVDLPLPDYGGPLKVVRPMLGVRRQETFVYCRERGLEPLIDRTNEDTRYPRNRVRLEVIPSLEAINPAVVKAITRLAESARGDLDVVEALSREAAREALTSNRGGMEIAKGPVRNLDDPIARRVMMLAYESVCGTLDGLGAAHVDAMLKVARGRAGAHIELPGALAMASDRDGAWLGPADKLDGGCPYPPEFGAQSLAVPGETEVGGGFRIVADVRRVRSPRDGHEWAAMLDPAIADQPLTVRHRRPGDRFHPLGMSVPVKLQDFFVNSGVPRRWRDRVPLVESPAGIAWVAGYRPAEWAKLAPSMDRALRIELCAPV